VTAEAAYTTPPPQVFYIHDDLSDDVRRTHREQSVAFQLSQELLALVRRDPQRVVVLQLEDQISRLVGQGSHAPFAMTVGIGQAGNFDLTIGAIVSTLMEPSDSFQAWYSKDGPQNYAKWHNETFQRLLPQIDRAEDDSKRHALVRQADDILEQDPALLPIAWLQCNDAWYTYVKGANPANFFGTYDVVRWVTAWLDK
jgi:ABC-type transport system substrate-binding protein